MTDSSSRARSPVFATTRWTQVLRARGETVEARAALADLCAAYWMPVFRFICRERDEETARDLTQEFFTRVLESSGVSGADPARGLFRSFLLGAVKHFLSDARRHEHRLKRGGGAVIESLDAAFAAPAHPESDTSCKLQVADERANPPDAFFDRHWALAIMQRALTVVESDAAESGKSDQFQLLKPWLAGDASDLSQAAAARQLGMNEGAVKVAVHRLRKKFREAVRQEISHTLEDPARIDDELRHLIQALAQAENHGPLNNP